LVILGVVNATISIIVCMQNLIQQYEITPFNFVKGDFEFELWALQVHMMVEVQAI